MGKLMEKGETMLDDMRQAQAMRDMIAEALQADYGNDHTWAGQIVRTLMQIAVSPDEYTEDAAVNAARLIWEIVNNG